MARLLSADVRIQHSALLKYHLVTISCKDRNKLFFDTVCEWRLRRGGAGLLSGRHGAGMLICHMWDGF